MKNNLLLFFGFFFLNCCSNKVTENSEIHIQDKVIQFTINPVKINPQFQVKSYYENVWIYFYSDSNCLISNEILNDEEWAINMGLIQYYETGNWHEINGKLAVKSKNLSYDFKIDDAGNIGLIDKLDSNKITQINEFENRKIEKAINASDWRKFMEDIIGIWKSEKEKIIIKRVDKIYQISSSQNKRIGANKIVFSGYDYEDESWIVIVDSMEAFRLSLESNDSLFRKENLILRKEYSDNYNSLVQNYFPVME